MARKPKAEKVAEPLEKTICKSADKLRKNMDTAEYKHIVLGLIFLKYISDAFERLKAGKPDILSKGTLLYKETAQKVNFEAIEKLCLLFECQVGDLLELTTQ